jgi:Tfp pilus assembly protein PilZ
MLHFVNPVPWKGADEPSDLIDSASLRCRGVGFSFSGSHGPCATLHRRPINNIRQGWACIRTHRPFRPGDDIALDLSRLGLKTHVEGRIAWTGPRSIGIEFRSVAADVKGVRYDFNIKRDGAMRTGKGVGMGKIRKRTVRWEPSDDAEKYRLYWSWKGPIGYESDFVEIGNKTMVILPDEVPSFPNIAGNIELGVTAVNAAGNESDITVAGVYVDFTVPEAPKALRMED